MGDVPQWVADLQNIPPWRPGARYPEGYCIIQSGIVYTANATFQSAATWAADAANWTALTAAGTELAYAELTANPAAFTNVEADIAGLNITFTAPARPVELSYWGYVIQQLGNAGNPQVKLVDGANTTLYGTAIAIGLAVGAYTPPWFISARLNTLTAGTQYTFKMRGLTSAGTAQLSAGGGYHAYLRATQC